MIQTYRPPVNDVLGPPFRTTQLPGSQSGLNISFTESGNAVWVSYDNTRGHGDLSAAKYRYPGVFDCLTSVRLCPLSDVQRFGYLRTDFGDLLLRHEIRRLSNDALF